jgi:hypothetical protein
MANNKNTLIQRIALDGGKEIEQELKSLGAAGEEAFAKLKEGADKLAKSGGGLNTFFTNLRRDMVAISDGAKLVKQGFNTIGAESLKLARNMALVQAAVAGAATALFLLTKSSADYVDEQNKAAQATGLSIKTYGRLQFAFEQGNVEAGQFGVAMKSLNARIIEAAAGTGAGAKLFKQFGISVKNADGSIRDAEEILKDLADRFAKLPDGAAKSAAAVQLFGRAGAAMVPVLNEGGAAMAKLGDEAERVGRVFTEQQATVGDAFGDALNSMTSAINGIRIQLGLLLAPAFTEAFTSLTAIIVENKDAILAIAQSLADNLLPLVRDFFAILKGDDAAVVNKNLLAIRDTILAIGQGAQIVGGVLAFAFDVLAAAIQPVLDLINIIFGTELEAKAVLFTLLIGQLLGVFRLFGAVVKGVQLIIAGLTTIFGTATGAVVAFIARIALLQGLIKVVVDKIYQAIKGLITNMGTLFSEFVDQIVGFFTGMGDTITSIFEGIFDFLKDLIEMAGKVIDEVGKAIFGGGGDDGGKVQSNARGGHIRGKGTGTSDSILSWLSNGEFVLRASAVRKWGVNALQALNAGRMPAFASGGLVGGASFALPSGGGSEEQAAKAFDLHIGNEVFEGLLAPETVAGKLVEFASKRSVRRTGTKPKWDR